MEGDFSHSAEPGLIGKHWSVFLGGRLHELAISTICSRPTLSMLTVSYTLERMPLPKYLGNSRLHRVIDQDSTPILLEYGADVNVKNSEGKSQLQLASGRKGKQ